MSKTIVLLGTFDTKGREFAYIKEIIEKRGHQTILIDAGIMGSPLIQPDISRKEVAFKGGSTIEELVSKKDRGFAIDIMSKGASAIVQELYKEGKLDGIISLGGSGGTALATAAMRTLPVGIPKVMVSTMASGDTKPYVGVKDISMMYSVVDISGINRLSASILTNAAGAICGMVEVELPKKSKASGEKPLIGATMFGVTTPCVERVRSILEENGCEVLVFHATGTGGMAMESLIESGFINAVADITTTEWCDELVGGVLSAGPTRLDAAGKAGIPQVVSVGALDMVNFGPMDTVPEKFRSRKLYKHNPTVTLMRTTVEENRKLGEIIAEKLNKAKGPVVLFIPLKGVSAIDREGMPFYDPEADAALFESIKEHLKPHVEIREMNCHINDPEFAEAMAKTLLQLIKK
ncbi:Uncharacterized conserved protein UCP033271 [Thermoanaerobacter ethanolicus JW 200]|uniref:Tm-1-like ATP-binding domain-containing protein n=1 Tax=Thermoanaerobacter ethanolicus TaxID=1757 RepID=UPI000202C7A3|nr:Uncharacterized conserved protein UCP033271 [Thermoanaerobacter ethanolicus JW 200]